MNHAVREEMKMKNYRSVRPARCSGIKAMRITPLLLGLILFSIIIAPVIAYSNSYTIPTSGYSGDPNVLYFSSTQDCTVLTYFQYVDLEYLSGSYGGRSGTWITKNNVGLFQTMHGTYIFNEAGNEAVFTVTAHDADCTSTLQQLTYTPTIDEYGAGKQGTNLGEYPARYIKWGRSGQPATGTITYYFDVYPSPVADFSANETAITIDDYVEFTDLSTNSPDCWLWYFDQELPGFPPYCEQSADSTDQNPVWQFTTYGYHNASLIVINDVGYDWETKENYIFANVDACDYLESVEIGGDSTIYTNTPEDYYLVTNMLSSDNISVIWGFTDGYNVYSPKNLYNYQKIEGSWFQYNETSMDYDIPVTEGDVTTQTRTFYLTSEQYPDHEIYVRVNDIDCAKIDIDSMDLTVTGAAYQHNLPIMVYDVSNGYLINNFNLQVHDYTAGTWDNYTGINSNMLIPVDLYHNIALIVTKSGYDLCDHGYPDNECSRYYIYPDNPVSLNVYLNAACGAPAGQSCEHISVQWGYGSDWGVGTPIAGASVTVNGTTYSTNSAGLVNIYLENDTSFGVTISRASFQTVYENLTSGAEDVHHWNYYELVPLSLITPTVTIPTVPVTTMNGTGVDWSIGRNRETRQWEMIGQLYEFGPFLISLFILGIIVEVMKKMGKR